MHFSTLALAISGAAIVKATNVERGVIQPVGKFAHNHFEQLGVHAPHNHTPPPRTLTNELPTPTFEFIPKHTKALRAAGDDTDTESGSFAVPLTRWRAKHLLITITVVPTSSHDHSAMLASASGKLILRRHDETHILMTV